MSDLFRHRATAVWAVLVSATFISWILGASHGAEGAGVRAATAVVLVIAFAKVRWVGLDFMELRDAALSLRVAFELWVLGVGCTLVALYLLA